MYYFCLIQINSLYILFVAGKYLLLELYSNTNLMGNCFHFKGVIQSCHPCTYFFSLVYSTQNFTNSMDNIVENFWEVVGNNWISSRWLTLTSPVGSQGCLQLILTYSTSLNGESCSCSCFVGLCLPIWTWTNETRRNARRGKVITKHEQYEGQKSSSRGLQVPASVVLTPTSLLADTKVAGRLQRRTGRMVENRPPTQSDLHTQGHFRWSLLKKKNAHSSRS